MRNELTRREEELLIYLARGMSNTEIAEQMGISYYTVLEHVVKIKRKTGSSNRVQCALYALRAKLVSLEDA